jgi:hypothetical protein
VNAAGWVAIIVALGGQAAILIPLWRRQAATKTAVDEVHTLVNDRSDKQLARMAQLEQALRAGGVIVPVDPALTKTNRGDMDR